jgi:hypothetical protein
MPDHAQLERIATELSKKLADEGKLIEAGWVGYRMMVLPPDAPQVQIDECRMAFMAGSQHLFSSIMSILDPGEGRSAQDGPDRQGAACLRPRDGAEGDEDRGLGVTKQNCAG